jgi:hypothetical protein
MCIRRHSVDGSIGNDDFVDSCEHACAHDQGDDDQINLPQQLACFGWRDGLGQYGWVQLMQEFGGNIHITTFMVRNHFTYLFGFGLVS